MTSKEIHDKGFCNGDCTYCHEPKTMNNEERAQARALIVDNHVFFNNGAVVQKLTDPVNLWGFLHQADGTPTSLYDEDEALTVIWNGRADVISRADTIIAACSKLTTERHWSYLLNVRDEVKTKMEAMIVTIGSTMQEETKREFGIALDDLGTVIGAYKARQGY